MLTAFAILTAFCTGALIISCFDDCRNGLASVKKELKLCEAEISHLVAKRDSRGRFVK